MHLCRPHLEVELLLLDVERLLHLRYDSLQLRRAARRLRLAVLDVPLDAHHAPLQVRRVRARHRQPCAAVHPERDSRRREVWTMADLFLLSRPRVWKPLNSRSEGF